MIRKVPESNRTAGNIFEGEFAEYMQSQGFWVHRLTQAAEGQPADLICQRRGCVWLIDCKVCKNDRFILNRVEYNQHRAMTAWIKAGGTTPWFALQMANGKVRMLSYSRVVNLEKHECKSVALWEDSTCTSDLDSWLTAVKLWEVSHTK